MAEIKNAFIKSRMNKDLDARLVPSGEYRDAMNISISQSEGGDVGAVENVKGNELKTLVQSLPAVANLVVIGNLMDDQGNYMYVFSTDWTGSGEAPITAKCFIHRYDANTNISLKLVEGSFLNFSTQNFISGVNLLEDLLFFTDNRNQPRVINVNSAVSDSAYYNREENVSVAKLAPFKAINVLNSNNETVGTVDTPNNEFTVIDPLATIYQGDFVSKGVVKVGVVNSFDSGTGIVTVDSGFILSSSDVVTFSRSGMINRTLEFLDDYNGNPAPSSSNPNYDVNWDGDPDFIKDKFIRFAYRYKFDNNEYSIISPFTATMFIPKQFGYFAGEDEERTYKSSIVAFMENYAQEMVLKIPFPSKDPLNDYKISEVDIIYKESDGLALQVLSTLQITPNFAVNLNPDEDNSFSFSYESKKPYKTLPEDDLIRVYDRVPIKAKAQEVIGNRVVYANYVDKNNFPNNIDYYVGAQQKDYGRYDNTAQYPYHSLKQSRTYQLGFVLSDKYGRSSSVILSSKDVNGGTLGRGSTHFHRYSGINENNPLTHPYGDALRVTVEGAIQELKDSVYPGTYADSTGKVWTVTPTSTTTLNTTTYTIDQDLTTKLFIGDSMQGKYVDYVEITNITEALGITTITTSDQIADYYADIPTADLAVYGYIINPLGWYSYKVVVKQTEQEYYNVYLPGIINGTFNFTPSVDVNQSSQVVLVNDNINKIPRDLSEVGPQQKKFRSSVRLYGRVTPAYVTNATTNNQWYPAKTSDNVSEIADAADFGYTTPQYDMYDFISNPLIAKIATITTTVGGNQISIGSLPSNAAAVFQLGVYETTPVETRLELFYETGTTGLISVLNKDTNNTSDTGATGVVDYVWAFSEGDAVPFNCTGDFKFIDGAGNELISGAIIGVPNIINVTNKNGVDVTSGTPFSVVQGTNADVFKIQASSTLTYVNGSSNANDYTFTIQVVTSGVTTNVLTEGNVTNVAPSFSPVDQQITTVIGDTTVIDFENPITVSNGSSIIAEKTSGLVYNVLSQELNGVAVSNFGMSGSTLEIIDQNGVVASNNYDVQVQVSDASGLDTNYLTAVNDLDVFIGNQPINYTITGNSNSVQGNGCRTSTSSFQNQTRIITFGVGNVGWDQNLPSGVYANNGYGHNIAELNPLTSGAIRFRLGVAMATCMTNSGTATFKVFIQFRQTSSSSWTSATDELGTAWPSGGKYVAFSGFQFTPVDVLLQDFDQAGQYRVIINADDGIKPNAICGAVGGGSCPATDTTLMSTFEYCDANINAC